MTLSNPLTLILLGMIFIKVIDFIIPIIIQGLICPIINHLSNQNDAY